MRVTSEKPASVRATARSLPGRWNRLAQGLCAGLALLGLIPIVQAQAEDDSYFVQEASGYTDTGVSSPDDPNLVANGGVCERIVTAQVVVFDKPLMYNRLGAGNVNGMMYALRRDVINVSSRLPLTAGGAAVKGQVDLRPDKRHRPLVLRVRTGDCLTVHLQNLLTDVDNPFNPTKTSPVTLADPNFRTIVDEQIKDRATSFHAAGMQVLDSIDNDGSWVGNNTGDGYAAPGSTKTYKLFAGKEGVYLVTGSAPIGSDANQGNSANGLFGQVIVQPKGALIYRSQVFEEELRLVADVNRNGVLDATEKTAGGQPKITNYEATYPSTAPWSTEGKGGLPILNTMQCVSSTSCEIVHSEINAVVAGPNADGSFPPATYPLESKGKRNPTVPNRLEPFRDFASLFHDETPNGQAFPGYFNQDPVFRYVLAGVRDTFMINYGSGGIGAEIIANRLGVGPMHDCLSCAYEEFFLTSFAVGDPALTVDVPANLGMENLMPGQLPEAGTQGPKASYVLGAEDPSNVHHSYIGDFVKFRNTHVGYEQHVFHLHNHQWLFNPNDDNSNYLDAQGLGPGVGYTYEINFGGSGNRNKSVGDAIFHCHFYPHFAQGMWYHWRNNDTLETGTILEATPATPDAQGFLVANGYHTEVWGLAQGLPKPGSRAYPDGEIAAGTPIPALVPLPGKPMPVMPGRVTTRQNPLMAVTNPAKPVGSLAKVIDRNVHPGFPFFIAGIEDAMGQRPPSPVLDMLTPGQATALKNSGNALWSDINPTQADGFDGGLPRHALKGLAAGGQRDVVTSRLDFSSVLVQSDVVYYPEEGTDLEQLAMAFHAQRCVPTFKPDGSAATCVADAVKGNVGGFILNGGKPVVGAPYHNPCMDDTGKVMKPGVVGRFFSGELPSGSQAALNTRGASRFDSDAPRIYKGTNLQFDVVLNKVGYHYPQQRIVALWQDVADIIEKKKAPEPLVMRLNTFDCAIYHHSNLVPEYYEIDDYQVRTPTDIIGQHIHLPKWDLTTTDGAANGWNYEDGTFSPGTVRERIHAIRKFNQCVGIDSGDARDGTGACPVAKDHPYWGKVANHLGAEFAAEWKGARTTTARWFTDPVVNTEGVDRGLGIVFTHDHFGPSTHQQIGLYSTVLTEPAGSKWAHNETGHQLGYDPMSGVPARTDTTSDGRVFSDGGPTSWQAAIIPQAQTGAYAGNTVKAQPCTATGQLTGVDCQHAFREFYFEYSDFQHAYEAGVYVGAGQDGLPLPGTGPGLAPQGLNAGNPNWTGSLSDAFRFAMNPPARKQVSEVFPDLLLERANTADQPMDDFCPVRPCPQTIDVESPGLLIVNYRQEPAALRVYDPNKIGPDGKPGMQADGPRGDLTGIYQSRTDRAIPEMNVMPDQNTVKYGTKFPPHINTGALNPADPFTPTLRVYAGDLVRVKMQAGGHEEEHNASIQGVKWLQAGSGHGSAKNSGWRNNQAGGISEQFTLSTPILPMDQNRGDTADYLYNMDSSNDGIWNGTWGLMRSYEVQRGDLYKLPGAFSGPAVVSNGLWWDGVCPLGAPTRWYDITAVQANRVLDNAYGVTIQPDGRVGQMHAGGPLRSNGGTLVMNNRDSIVSGTFVNEETGETTSVSRQGPLHDPTAIMYVRTSDLDAYGKLRSTAPVEPLVLRALPGECVKVTLRNRLQDNADYRMQTGDMGPMPDLATFTSLHGVVKRDRNSADGTTTFNNNLIRSSGYVGIRPQLVAYDVTRDYGMPVGQNPTGQVAYPMGGTKTYTWFAGDIGGQPYNGQVELKATPIEFGGVNLMPSDPIKQGAKGLVGALVVEPASKPFLYTKWTESTRVRDLQDGAGTRFTRAQATVCPNLDWITSCSDSRANAIRDFSLVMTKGNSIYYKDGWPLENISGEGVGVAEDSQDSTQMALNYSIEPLWFRFGLVPHAPFGPASTPGSYASVPNAHKAYSNLLLTSTISCSTDGNAICTGDPATPVFLATAGKEARIRLTVPHGTSRGSTFALHGHQWQRDPYVCPNQARNGLTGACDMRSVGSLALGDNPTGFNMGGQESWSAVTHFDIRLPKAGGIEAVKGDYLFRDQGAIGNAAGLWGLMRVK